ncbi:fimbria/pilus periplasmic chaperone [Klebsiella michiganensis]|uniref:fimbria/pilus periplasmic chaperone n=1 Tax=Klebsiella michiganensis TaxID=1134687 RepID=UPI002940117B|nr:fimbria/pilus periplasmic chaperone [Klebsiella michiganensis]
MKVNKTAMAMVVGSLAAGLMNEARAAIALDRTRAIFPGSERSISLNITNDSTSMPYLAQGWIEDEQGTKISGPLVVVPPLQRLEAKGKSVMRINAMPDAALLPQDRESLFYFNVREVPPKSDRPNVMQLALHTKIKLFYRPQAILPEKYSRWDNQLVLHKVSGGYRVENPTPYYMTVIGITAAPKVAVASGFQTVMVPPKSTSMVNSAHYTAPHVTTINDFGGKPTLPFNCSGNVCRSTGTPGS